MHWKKEEIKMLDALFKPKSIAIVGASNNPFSIGHIVLQNLVDHNYKGPIFPINPKAAYIKSFKAYPSVSAVPDDIDLVNISVKNTLVPMVLEDCGKKGVKFAIVHTAGFKEVGGEGIALEKQIVEIAHKYGMRVYGPNSQGIQNSDPEISVYANFTFVPMTPGNISIVAQSGGVGETLKLPLYHAGMGLRMYSSFGNEADVGMNEIIDYYGNDPETKVIMTHIETLKDPKGFLDVAKRVTAKKPILALKTGRTSEGRTAVASHTGSLMDQDTLTDAIFEQAGVLRFYSQEEMVQAAIGFSEQPVPRGDRVCIVTNTGGPAIIAVDEGISKGLTLAKLTSKTVETLKELVFKEASISNPVDVVATAGPEQYGGTVAALMDDRNIDAILLVFVTAPFVDCEGIARKLSEIGKTAKKPIVCHVITIEKWAEVIRLIRAGGVPVYDYPETAARALSAMVKYGKFLKREKPAYKKFRCDKKKALAIIKKYKGKGAFLPQDAVFDILKCYGIPAVKTVAFKKASGLERAAKRVGFPLVLKVDAETVVHKSDAGGVVLDIKSQRALQTAFDKMAKKFAGEKPGFIVQEFLTGGREVIMGLKGNEGLAPTIMFGLGGVFVETMKDVRFKLAPLSPEDAHEMMESIKGYPILKGIRGQQGADIDKLAEALMRLSQLGSDLKDIEEMDINPVLAFAKGVAVVDARIKVR